MSDMSPGSTDPTPTAPYDPAPFTPTPPVIGPAGGTDPVPRPTPPSSTWRDRRDHPGRTGTIIFGVILVAVGLWFFADQTLGFDMPRLRWSELWPLLIIGIGGWIVLGSMRRG